MAICPTGRPLLTLERLRGTRSFPRLLEVVRVVDAAVGARNRDACFLAGNRGRDLMSSVSASVVMNAVSATRSCAPREDQVRGQLAAAALAGEVLPEVPARPGGAIVNAAHSSRGRRGGGGEARRSRNCWPPPTSPPGRGSDRRNGVRDRRVSASRLVADETMAIRPWAASRNGSSVPATPRPARSGGPRWSSSRSPSGACRGRPGWCRARGRRQTPLCRGGRRRGRRTWSRHRAPARRGYGRPRRSGPGTSPAQVSRHTALTRGLTDRVGWS